MKRIINTDFRNRKTLEKYSSAFTLSDMEIFIFPDLFYPLVLANIMSPIIWKWREDPWFDGIEKKSFTYKTNRIKQFIIQNYVFNLDLATWGLTDKTREIDRFKDFFDTEMLKQSNALFGYEGDKYYFDIDIRKHFGLDKYDSDVIPYWKTETVEAMTAFRHRENFTTGAGECVSLSSLYAAAMFVVGRIPLEKIFLIATPLHSQNFITEKEGLITNNRRIVTRNMWFNGTALSEKARRALENEKVTVVSHITGHIHILYREATIDRKAYDHFTAMLKSFLITGLTSHIFINFLRFKPVYKSLFQFVCECSGVRRYIPLDKMFEYEHTSRFSVSKETREQLIREIEGDEFHLSPISDRILLNSVEEFLDNTADRDLQEIEQWFMEIKGEIPADTIRCLFSDLGRFTITEPRLPSTDKEFTTLTHPVLSVKHSRQEIIDIITRSAGESEMSLLTLYAYRQMDRIDWRPFIMAAIERNPVSFEELRDMNLMQIHEMLRSLPDESIYDGNRLAMPDEVWNFRRGDGVEKAFLLAANIINRDKEAFISLKIENKDVNLTYKGISYSFTSKKSFRKSFSISTDSAESI
ncbi:MAG TPA: hypothetical protein PLV06_06975 [Bacteroidales bacterium]|nr:hypothetical protein [Bacteroidales bacterium]HPF02272.1 hypothetical protein [Bacteroidales bacterium]HPJ60533.1 hypothetical protein [Bacteroidales bacterium]HPR12108.1 hypothetical protein [Bacteroidales bacterium]HRW85308.1 hypothetical protein [Bacteroidales bacterium]